MKSIPEDIERQIVEKARHRDASAMERIYDYLSAYLNGICTRYISDDEDERDVFQDTMVRIFENLRRFRYRGEGSLRAWGAKIAVNECLMYLRKRKRAGTVPLMERDCPEEDPPVPEIGRLPPEVLMGMIRELPPRYRTVFNLYVFEEKSHREIAGLLGIREDSSASNLHRAKKILADKITQYGKDHE